MNFVSRNAFFPRFIFFTSLFAIAWSLGGCDKSAPTGNESKLEQSSKIVQDDPQILITEKLSHYYDDLSKGQIQVSDYYAPSVERFFSSQNISRDQIAKSLQNSITQNPGRNLRLIPSSVKTIKSGNITKAEIAGIATKTDAEGALISKDTFRNMISFNQQMEIVGYESVAAPAQSRKLGARYAEKESLINDVLMALKTGKLSAVKDVVHPDMRAYFVYKTGLFPAVEPISALADIKDILHQDISWPDIQSQSTAAPIPSFDCDDEFAQQGCFYQQLDQAFVGLSETIEFANQAEKRMDESVLGQIKKIEQLISYQVVDTKTGLSLFLGESDGRWYVFVIDLALYDCSA